jgi:hypothetical protein
MKYTLEIMFGDKFKTKIRMEETIEGTSNYKYITEAAKIRLIDILKNKIEIGRLDRQSMGVCYIRDEDNYKVGMAQFYGDKI